MEITIIVPGFLNKTPELMSFKLDGNESKIEAPKKLRLTARKMPLDLRWFGQFSHFF